MSRHPVAGMLAPALLCAAACATAQPAPRAPDLADLTLEQLADIEVTSVSRRAERLADAPASIYVITADDIRRSGVRTLPEALRLAPNLQVARTSASQYAISARGFNNSNGLSNKLLVLIDGRTVYSPVMSGVFWDMQDVMLEDVERIEVISGPGATLWGANAVNGVINVITRPSQNTQGGLVALGAGNLDKGAALRYGGKLGESGHFRVYGKTFELQNTRTASEVSLPDGSQRGQVGFRADWAATGQQLTLQGNAYEGKTEDRPLNGSIEVSGANLLARWTGRLASGSDLNVQAYYDRTEREDRALLGFPGAVDVFDLEFQHGIPVGAHRFLWGGGYRHARDDVPASAPLPAVAFLRSSFVPRERTLTWQNVFAQGEFRLSEKVELTAGLKLESNDYTGWEFLPDVRLAWKLAPEQLVWGAASRAIRAPARLDRDLRLDLLIPVLNLTIPVIAGGPYFQSEVATVYQIGYRAQPVAGVSYSITAFRHNYDKLRSGQPGVPPGAFIENLIAGFENGVEGWASWQVMSAWRLTGGFSTLRQHLGLKPGSTDPVGPIALGNDPDHQWLLRSSHNIAARHELDVMVRRVGSLLPVAPPAPQIGVPAYTAVDARWGWKATRDLELSLTLTNLFDSQHAEFGAVPGRSEYERGVFLKMLWRM